MKKEVYVTAVMEIEDFEEMGIFTDSQIGGSGTSQEDIGDNTNIGNITIPGYGN